MFHTDFNTGNGYIRNCLIHGFSWPRYSGSFEWRKSCKECFYTSFNNAYFKAKTSQPPVYIVNIQQENKCQQAPPRTVCDLSLILLSLWLGREYAIFFSIHQIKDSWITTSVKNNTPPSQLLSHLKELCIPATLHCKQSPCLIHLCGKYWVQIR